MKYPTYLPTDFVKQDDKARFKSYLNGFKPLGSDYEPTKAAPDLYTEAARIAREKGYDDDAGRVVQAILRTEGALSGEVGDKDLPGAGSFGPLQFYRKYGMLPSYAKSLGVSEDDAAEHARKNPTHAIDWALGGYLGNAIRAGQAKGLRGAELATYAQQHGQRSQAPERAGQNYSAMFGGGQPIPAHAPTAIGPREAAIPAHGQDDRAEFGKYLSSFPELGSDLQMGKEKAIPAHEPKDDKQAFGEFLDSFPKLGGDLLGEAAKQLPFVGPALKAMGQQQDYDEKVVSPQGELMYGPLLRGETLTQGVPGIQESIVRGGAKYGPMLLERGLGETAAEMTKAEEATPEPIPGVKGALRLGVPTEALANLVGPVEGARAVGALERNLPRITEAAGKALPEAGRLGRALAGEAGEQLLERTPMRTFAGDLGKGVEDVSRKAAKEPWEMTLDEWERGAVYHGTKGEFQDFDLRYAGQSDPGLVGKGVYFTPTKDQARQFAESPHYGRGGIPRVIAAKVDLKNPVIITDGALPDGRRLSQIHPKGITKESAAKIHRELVEAGYDGAIFKTAADEVTQVVAFDPSSINQHRQVIAQALASGRSVPPEVLADYPDLAASQTPVKQIAPEPTLSTPAERVGAGDSAPIPVSAERFGLEASAPRTVELPDRDLGAIYRDWVAMRDYRESAYPSEERLQKYAGWARRLLAGEERVSAYPPEEFARFARIRMRGKELGQDLGAVFRAYKNGQDFPEIQIRTVGDKPPELSAPIKEPLTKPPAIKGKGEKVEQGPQRAYDEQLDQAIQFQRQKYDSLHATDPDVDGADDAPIVQTLEGIREARQLAQRTGDMPEVQRALLDNSKRIEQLPEVQAALSEGTVPSTKAKGQKIEQPKARDAAETVAEEGAEQGVQQVQGDEGGVPRVPPRAGASPTAGNAANRTLLEMYTKGPSGEGGQGAWDRLGLVRRAFVRATTDRDVDLAQFQKAAQKAKGTPLSADEMAYELNRLNPDKSAEVAIQDSLKPAIQAAGDDRAWLSVYLTHLDNIDVARAMGQKVERELGAAAGAKAARERKFSGGLDVAASRQALADMTQELGPERMQKIEVAARQVQEFVKGRRDRLAEAGVIPTELRDALAEMYPNYVPTRILDYMQEPVNIARGKSLSLSDTGLRRNTIEGTVREREDPLASLVRLAYQSEATARKNEAFNAFVKLREMMPDVQDKIREVADNYVVRRNEAKVTGFVEGKRVTYAMPKELEAVIKAEPGAVIPGLVGDVWGALMHGFRAAATSRFPLFLATNALLDAATYATRASIREGGPQHLPRVLIELGRSYGDAFSGLFTREYHGTTAEFLRRGGGQFGFFQGTPGATRRTVQDLSRKHIFEIQSAKDIARLTRDLVTFKPVEAIGERIELAPRVAMYNLASRRTNTVKAVIEGRTVTIDFSQGGNISKLLNQFIPFFNVGMQALVQPVRAFAENPRAFVASVGTLIVGPTIAAEAWNRADPQRAKDYDDVPDYIKDQGVVIMLPIEAPIDSRGNRRPQFFLIRMREFAPFAIAAREAANRAMGGEVREWQDLIGSGVMSVSPVQGNSLGDVVAGFSPLGVSTAGQLAANYDYFRGRMIATKGGDERASEVSKVLANALGVRPSQVEFAIRDLTAGLGGTALAAGQIATGKVEATGAIQDVPVVGGLAGRFVKSSIGGNLDRAQARLISPQGKQILKDNGIDLSIGPVGNTIEGVPLNVEEQTMYQELTNQYLDEALREIIKLPKWAEYDMDVRADIARGAVDGARDGAGAEVFKKMGNEEIRRRLKALKEAS